jgi:TrpR family transcriptional regulator, trp operon repressor
MDEKVAFCKKTSYIVSMHRNILHQSKVDTDSIAEVFAGITDGKMMQRFFDEIFTEAEKKDIALRWRLLQMLRSNVPQRKIASELGISLCKITRGAKLIKDRTSITNMLLSRHTNQTKGVCDEC